MALEIPQSQIHTLDPLANGVQHLILEAKDTLVKPLKKAAKSKKSDLTCWILDTRSIWQGEKIADAAPDELKLISHEERQNILRKYHIADARMSLASALLKRAFISKTLNVPYEPADGSPSPVEFNVSHQAGLVALIGCRVEEGEVGCDIVYVNERDDYRTIDAEGFDGWVDLPGWYNHFSFRTWTQRSMLLEKYTLCRYYQISSSPAKQC